MHYPTIIEDFLELVELEVHSFKERALADVVKVKLEALGCEVFEDDAAAKIGGNAGNVIGRLKGRADAPAIMFSAHMDRVENHGRIKPVILEAEGKIVSDGTSILGADDVSGICAILDGLRRVKAENLPHGDIEIVFSPAEEVGLLGAKNLDYSKIKSKIAYVFDSGGPLGTIVNQAPTQYKINVVVHGQSAHAGIAPERGLSAIKVGATALSKIREGRLSPFSTSNFGAFHAGKVTNIICDRAEILGEARSSKPEELNDYLNEVKRIFAETAEEFSTTIDLKTSLEYTTFTIDESDEVIELAMRALRNMAVEPKVQSSGGGMDGNYFNLNGIKAVGLAPGYNHVHTSKEEQPIDPLIKSGQLVAEIIKAAVGR